MAKGSWTSLFQQKSTTSYWLDIITGRARHHQAIDLNNLPALEKIVPFLALILVAVVFFALNAEWLVRLIPPRLDYFGILDDLARAAAFGKASAIMAYSQFTGRVSSWYMFERTAKRNPQHTFFVFEGKKWTYGQALEDANRLSRFWLKQGIKKDDTVAVIVPNKPTFVILWLSFMAIGVAPAFINYNLTGDSLKHCINISGAKFVLFDPDVEENVQKVEKDLEGGDELKLMIWIDGLSKAEEKRTRRSSKWTVVTEDSYKSLETTTLPHSPHRSGINWKTPVVHIFTSGTSGMPKMAPCSQAKFQTGALTWCRFANWSKNDIVYTPLPLYHSSAAFLCVGAAIANGTTVALSRKFSASKFFAEVRETEATVVQYIGELCRYLLSKDESPDDKNHRVRCAYGNGLRPDIWKQFKKRFGIPTINEFYASTEGNVFLFNYNRSNFGAGGIGRESIFGSVVAGDYIVRVKDGGEDLYRNKKGWCEMAAHKEAGELLVRIDTWHPAKGFAGYKGNKGASDEKIVSDVFRKGDAYFRTGDLLSRDANGFYYFEDRLGDTFRWKGENVATSEVSSAVLSYDSLEDVAVYGVELPKHDGRAGCVAIPKEQFNTMTKSGSEEKALSGLVSHVEDRLPKYAWPMFIRVIEKMELTSTHKIVTTGLRKEGVDPEKTGEDKVFYLAKTAYKPFGKEQWSAISEGKMSL